MLNKVLATSLALSLAILVVCNASALGQQTAANPTNPSSSPDQARLPDLNGTSSEPQAPSTPPVGRPGQPASASPDSLLLGPSANPAQPSTGENRSAPEPSLEPLGAGMGGFSPFMSPVVGRAPFRADYQAAWFAPEAVAGQNTNLGYVRQDLSFGFPLWQNGTCDEWFFSANLRSEIFQTHAIFPDTGQPFPQDVWNIRFSTTYRHLFDNGWIGGGSVSVGSASDKPFNSINEMTAGLNAFLRVPEGEHNAWLFTLSYSPTSELPIPIPGVAFVWQPSDTFRANIGLPFQIMWRPAEDLTFDLSYMLLTTVHARATYRVCRPVRLYLAYAWENEAYLPADRPDNNDRLYDVDQRLTAGALVNLNQHASLDFSGGYIFDHYYFEGKNILNGTNFNRIDVADGPYVSLKLLIRW